MSERWVGDWTKIATYWSPSSSGYSSTSFSSCGAAQPESLMTQLSAGSGSHCFELQPLTPNSDFQLTRTSCSTGLYNGLISTCFGERRICTQFNPSTVKVIPWYLRSDAPVIYTGAFLIWQLGRVGGQYVTAPQSKKSKSDYGFWSWLDRQLLADDVGRYNRVSKCTENDPWSCFESVRIDLNDEKSNR